MKAETTRTNQAAARALAAMQACKSSDDFKLGVKKIVQDLLETSRLLETEMNVAWKSNAEWCGEVRRLNALLKDVASRSNGDDPAMQIILNELGSKSVAEPSNESSSPTSAERK